MRYAKGGKGGRQGFAPGMIDLKCTADVGMIEKGEEVDDSPWIVLRMRKAC